MSVQLFFQARLLGIDEFLAAQSAPSSQGLDADLVALGRHYYASLIVEVLPRAVLEKLRLSRMLLGASGGGEFLLLLPQEVEEQATELLQQAAAGVSHLSGGLLQLIYGTTENLGAWVDARRRLNHAMEHRAGTSEVHPWTFDVGVQGQPPPDDFYFADLGSRLREARQVGYDPSQPGRLTAGFSAYTFALNNGPDSITFVQHAAIREDGATLGSQQLAQLARGQKRWGVLRGEVDHYAVRLRRAETIEDHLQTSVIFKNFFAGEIHLQCVSPEFFKRITVLFTSNDGFAVYGPWDALIAFARELHRVFQRFSEELLREYAGTEGKTISMSLAIAGTAQDTLPRVYGQASRDLVAAKALGRDQLFLLGRAIDWKQLSDAAELKDDLVRIIRDYDYPAALLYELGRYYREHQIPRRGKLDRLEKPWRFYRRITNVFGETRNRQVQRLRASVISDFIGKNTAQARLRPAGRVALEWAHLTLSPATTPAEQ